MTTRVRRAHLAGTTQKADAGRRQFRGVQHLPTPSTPAGEAADELAPSNRAARRALARKGRQR